MRRLLPKMIQQRILRFEGRRILRLPEFGRSFGHWAGFSGFSSLYIARPALSVEMR